MQCYPNNDDRDPTNDLFRAMRSRGSEDDVAAEQADIGATLSAALLLMLTVAAILVTCGALALIGGAT